MNRDVNNIPVIIIFNGKKLEPILTTPGEKVASIIEKFKQATNCPAEVGVILTRKSEALSEYHSLSENQVIPDESGKFYLECITIRPNVVTQTNVYEIIALLSSRTREIENTLAILTQDLSTKIEKLEDEIRKRPKFYIPLYYPGECIWILPDDPNVRLASAKKLLQVSDAWVQNRSEKTFVYMAAANSNIFQREVWFDADDEEEDEIVDNDELLKKSLSEISSLEATKSNTENQETTSDNQKKSKNPPVKRTVKCVRILTPAVPKTDDYGDFNCAMVERRAIVGWTIELNEEQQFVGKDVMRTKIKFLGDGKIVPVDEEAYVNPIKGCVVPTSDLFS